jgi:hypothetical protein
LILLNCCCCCWYLLLELRKSINQFNGEEYAFQCFALIFMNLLCSSFLTWWPSFGLMVDGNPVTNMLAPKAPSRGLKDRAEWGRRRNDSALRARCMYVGAAYANTKFVFTLGILDRERQNLAGGAIKDAHIGVSRRPNA